MNADGRTADISAWVTLASSDSTSFADADAAVIAGRINREDGTRGVEPRGGELVLRCYLTPYLPASVPMPAPPPAPAMAPIAEMADVVVTAQRAMPMNAPVAVRQEELGDLKLYRVPVPVTVAANAQKQVALVERKAVKMEVLYRAEVWEDSIREVRQMLRTRNRREEGLGLPLPGGPVTVFEPHGDALLLVGEGGLDDRAEGEDVEILLGNSGQVSAVTEVVQQSARSRTIRLTVGNARPVPVRFEARIASAPATRVSAVSGRLRRENGRSVFPLLVPANGRAIIAYKLVTAD